MQARSASIFARREGSLLMPSKSPSQARLMAAAAHTAGGYGGVPQAVGKEFNAADTGTKLLSKAAKGAHPHKNLGKYLHAKKPGR